MIKLRASGIFDLNRFLVNALEFIGVVIEPDPRRGEVQIVVDPRVAGKETAGTDAEIVQAVVDNRVVEIRNSRRLEILADCDCIAARHKEQLVGLHCAFAHPVQLARGGCCVCKFQIAKDGFGGCDGAGRGSGSNKQKYLWGGCTRSDRNEYSGISAWLYGFR